jgi:hypothetical protein
MISVGTTAPYIPAFISSVTLGIDPHPPQLGRLEFFPVGEVGEFELLFGRDIAHPVARLLEEPVANRGEHRVLTNMFLAREQRELPGLAQRRLVDELLQLDELALEVARAERFFKCLRALHVEELAGHRARDDLGRQLGRSDLLEVALLIERPEALHEQRPQNQ